MNKETLPGKKSSAWVGVVFVLTALVVIGYYWFGQDHESRVRPQHQKKHIQDKIIKKDGHILTADEQMYQFNAKKGIEYPDQGDNSDNSRRGGSVQNNSFLPVTSHDKHIKSSEQNVEERFVQSKATDSEQQTMRGTGIAAEAEISPDEPDYSDGEPPEVIAIRFDPKRVSPMADVSIYVEATDNLSGVTSISGTVKSPSETAVLSFGCQRLGSDGSFVGTLEIPDRAEMGAWYLNSLRVTDKVHNSRSYFQNNGLLRNSYFEIVESDSDNVPPQVTAVYLDPSQVYGGDRVQVTVEADDDKSGVGRIYGVLISPSKNARLSFVCRNEPESNIFNGYVSIPEDSESGYWSLQYLRAEDEARNAKTFYRTNYPSIFDNANVYVFSNSSDSQPAMLDNLIIRPPAVAYEETAEIIVYASDDISGIGSISGRLLGPSGNAHIPFWCVYDQENQEYKAEVIIRTNTEVGLWRVDYIRMVDKARNEINYVYQTNPLVKQAVFEIIGQ